VKYVLWQVLVLYQMYEHGMVKSLDDPLSNYCPGFSIRNPYGSSNITLRQMAAQVLHSWVWIYPASMHM